MKKLLSVFILRINIDKKVELYSFDSLEDLFSYVKAMNHYHLIDIEVHEVLKPSRDLKPVKLGNDG